MKWPVKKKAFAAVCLVLALAVIGAIAYYVFKPDKGASVTLTTVQRGNITQKIDTSGTVQSAHQGVFKVIEGTVVDEVYVRVGDRIEAGELLASFDTSSLDEVVRQKKNDRDSAKKAYQDYVNTAKNSASELTRVNREVAVVEAKVKELEKAVEVSKEQEAAPAKAENEVGGRLFSLLGLNSSDTVLGRIVNLFGGNSSSSSAIAAMLGGNAMSSFDMSSISSMLGQSEEEQALMSATLELVQLKANQMILQLQGNTTMESMYKSLYDNAEKAYESTVYTVEALRKGWYAEYGGIVREVNIMKGMPYFSASGDAAAASAIDVTTILSMLTSSSSGGMDITKMISGLFADNSSGMVIEYYPFEVRLVLGKYDVSKVHMDQPVKLTSVSGREFEGNIVYISPVASTDSSINISSILGSSGSSSGVEARIAIPEPDESVIIGFDVNISIDVETSEDAVLVPMGSLQYDSENSVYVFLYDSKEKTVSRTEIVTGLFDGVNYEILSGLSVGDVIVKSPYASMKDGDKIDMKALETAAETNE